MPAPPEDGYRSLSVADVLSDLPSLDREQLLLVKALEEACEGRLEILDQIDRLLAAGGTKPAGGTGTGVVETGVAQTGSAAEETLVRKVSRARPVRAHRERGSASPTPVSAPPTPQAATPTPPPEPKPAEPKAARPPKASRRGRATASAPPENPGSVQPATPVAPALGSAELMDQMGGLLAKDEERRTPMQAAWPMPELEEIDLETATALIGTDQAADAESNQKAGRKAKGRRGERPSPVTGPPAAGQDALIVPGDGRRAKGRRRIRKLLAGLIAVAVAVAGGTAYWKSSHKAATAAAIAPSKALVAALVTGIPNYVPSPGSTVAATPVALAAAVQDYGSTTAAAVAEQPTGFLAGVQRRWTNPTDPSQAVWVFVMEFENPTLASIFETQVA